MKIGLYWYPIPNVGDVINPLMLPHIFPRLRSMDDPDVDAVFLGVGSILGVKQQHEHLAGKPRIVWGTGYQYEAPRPLPSGSQFIFVRGYWTCERYGLNTELGAADPAILAPFHFPRTVQPTKGTGRVLKWNAVESTDPDTRTARITKTGLDAFLNWMWQYERLDCDSLHAAILADAYGIMWRPLRWEPKWFDHFFQLGIKYRPETYTVSNREMLAARAMQLMSAVESLNSLME